MWIELLLIVGLAAWVGHAVWRACVRGAGGEAAEAGGAEAPPAATLSAPLSAPLPAPPPSGPSSGPPPG